LPIYRPVPNLNTVYTCIPTWVHLSPP